MRAFLLFFVFFSSSCFACFQSDHVCQAEKMWKTLPIEHEGRIKPFDTFAREVLIKTHKKDRMGERSAVALVLSWHIIPEVWYRQKFIFVETEVKKAADFDLKRKHFTPEEIFQNEKFGVLFKEVKKLLTKKEKLNSFFKKVLKVHERLLYYPGVHVGTLLKIEPGEPSWKSVGSGSPFDLQFRKTLHSYVRLIGLQEGHSVKDYLSSKKNLDGVSSPDQFQIFKENFLKLKKHFKGSEKRLNVEIFYNSIKPFTKAWIFYLLFLLSFLTLITLKTYKRALSLMPWILGFSFLGFLFHVLGMAFRSYIMLRPPVSNMYETVVWVPLVALIVGFIFYLKGGRIIFVASNLIAFFCLLLTSLAPDILDGSLKPLEAVLNSSFWLITHVLIITISYSFFALSFVLSDMALISFLFKKKQPLSWVKNFSVPIYRCLQFGELFLALGVILGAIWADLSWGRFWGWDPKESWALVSFLSYLALLHGRLMGWVKDFYFAISCVLMFFTIIMAWYGVNFVLGAGLHSYGFGTGGVEYVLGFLLLHLVLCALSVLKYKKLSP